MHGLSSYAKGSDANNYWFSKGYVEQFVAGWVYLHVISELLIHYIFIVEV